MTSRSELENQAKVPVHCIVAIRGSNDDSDLSTDNVRCYQIVLRVVQGQSDRLTDPRRYTTGDITVSDC